MAESKHTPGPWKCDEVRTQVGRAFRIGAGEMLEAGKGCCIIYDDYPGNPDNERAANARLIAAAPDMLEALRVLAEEADNFSVSGVYFNEKCMGHKGLDMAFAAIAKATGGA